jgi:hypothetical protein
MVLSLQTKKIILKLELPHLFDLNRNSILLQTNDLLMYSNKGMEILHLGEN